MANAIPFEFEAMLLAGKVDVDGNCHKQARRAVELLQDRGVLDQIKLHVINNGFAFVGLRQGPTMTIALAGIPGWLYIARNIHSHGRYIGRRDHMEFEECVDMFVTLLRSPVAQ